MDAILNNLFEIIYSLMGIIITCVVIPYIRNKWKATKYEYTANLIADAVGAAEQKYINRVGKFGIQKNKSVKGYLETQGIDINCAEVNNMIENAVYSLEDDPKYPTVTVTTEEGRI